MCHIRHSLYFSTRHKEESRFRPFIQTAGVTTATKNRVLTRVVQQSSIAIRIRPRRLRSVRRLCLSRAACLSLLFLDLVVRCEVIFEPVNSICVGEVFGELDPELTGSHTSGGRRGRGGCALITVSSRVQDGIHAKVEDDAGRDDQISVECDSAPVAT